jgi:hypothetical protein
MLDKFNISNGQGGAICLAIEALSVTGNVWSILVAVLKSMGQSFIKRIRGDENAYNISR